jgi:hypothetical protein
MKNIAEKNTTMCANSKARRAAAICDMRDARLEGVSTVQNRGKRISSNSVSYAPPCPTLLVLMAMNTPKLIKPRMVNSL